MTRPHAMVVAWMGAVSVPDIRWAAPGTRSLQQALGRRYSPTQHAGQFALAGSKATRDLTRPQPRPSNVVPGTVALAGSVAALVRTAARRRRTAIRRWSFEPFGGVYARDWALKPRGSRPGPEAWIWLPGFAVVLAVAWQVAGSWTNALVALSVISYMMQCYWPVWEDQGVLTADTLRAHRSSHRLVASAFLHANWYHLGVNMYSLWYFGHVVERFFSPGRFLLVYLGSAVACALASLWAKRRRGRGGAVPSVGASGGVLGIVVALAVFQWRHGLPFQGLALTLLANFAIGIFSPEVDNTGHFGGTAGGALIAYLWGPRYVQSLGGLLVRDIPIIRWPFM